MPDDNSRTDFDKYDFVSVDVETNGLDSSCNEVVEVAVHEFNMNREFGSSIVQLCRPASGIIPPEVSEINGITYEMVKDKPTYLTDIQRVIAEFIGNRTAIGHNILGFDLGFLKITPNKVVDTLKLCRSRFPRGKNNLKASCVRMGIKWDDSKAHSALYDVDKCIELFWALNGIEAIDEASKAQRNLFAAPAVAEVESNRPNYLNIGVTPDQTHLQMLATQSYSYSRIRLFRECNYRWYFEYILKIKQPEYDYLKIGNAAHFVVERSGEWCQKELFINKFEAWSAKTKPVTPDEIMKSLQSAGLDVSSRSIGSCIYDNRDLLRSHYDDQGLAHLHYKMDNELSFDDYEHPKSPDMETYSKIIMRALTESRMEDSNTISEFETMMWRFYAYKDFSKAASIVSLTEKKLAFNSKWEIENFFSLNVFFRGIIDLIEYSDDTVIITDYKSSRTMKTQRELKNDMQLKVYILLLFKFLPPDSFKKVLVKIEYVRFCQTIEYMFENAQQAAEEALHWIYSAINDIELEMLKKNGDAFLPTRNEHCSTCHIGIDGKCPLFNKNLIQNIDTDSFIVSNEKECAAAWKRIEADAAESKKLTQQCKAFMKTSEKAITIDEKAKLDFWVNETCKFDPYKTAIMLLHKGHKFEDFLSYMSFPTASFEKFIARNNIEITDEELNNISKKSVEHTFDAYTPEEARNKHCLNAPPIEEPKQEEPKVPIDL